MSRFSFRVLLGFGIALAAAQAAMAQAYIGYVYPAGGQQGTTFQVTMGGQELPGVDRIFVSGEGVTARVVEYNKRMNPQEITLISEQMRELKNPPGGKPDPKYSNLITRIERLIRDNVDQPASASIANLLIAEVTIASNAPPGPRELRIGTPRGISNPLVFIVGELPELAGPPVPPSRLITLGKESASLRRKIRTTNAPPAADSMMMAMMNAQGPSALPNDLDDDLVRIQIPCTANGQITSGSVDRYRFAAKKGQHLVIRVQARELIPFMADAVPGWFQPVIKLWDAKGREVAYDDDYRFKPDPVILYDVPEDGDYLVAIHDAIYRGREDFVYRLSVGELPFITSIFPPGGRSGTVPEIAAQGVNLTETKIEVPAQDAASGIRLVTTRGKGGFISNRVPFESDTMPECVEKEPNDAKKKAQSVTLPIIVNGRIDTPGDQDIFQFEGHAGEKIIAEVTARRLDSPLDSVLKLTDSDDQCVAINDDREDIGSGMNTHHADSYIAATLPKNGTYFLRIADTQHKGGTEYTYRLRISPPQVDFALRVVPSSMIIRSNAPAYPKVYAIRKDGYTGPIKIGLRNPPPGFEMIPVTLIGTQSTIQVAVKTTLRETKDPVHLIIEGWVTNATQRIAHDAVPAEDRMQAFLWRHLVPAQELAAVVLPPPPPPPKAEPAKPAAKPVTPTTPPPATPAKPEPAKQTAAASTPPPKI